MRRSAKADLRARRLEGWAAGTGLPARPSRRRFAPPQDEADGCSSNRPRVRASPEMQNARSASRRAQFQLWIFSYTIWRRSSKKRVSRLMIA
jgi:hypothetical protein